MKSKTYYHVTLKDNINSIMEHGLIPQIGERSNEMNEEVAVFLFPNKNAMEDAVCGWLGAWYDEDEIISLKISLPIDFPVQDGSVAYEKISKVVIPPKYIKVFREEYQFS